MIVLQRFDANRLSVTVRPPAQQTGERPTRELLVGCELLLTGCTRGASCAYARISNPVNTLAWHRNAAIVKMIRATAWSERRRTSELSDALFLISTAGRADVFRHSACADKEGSAWLRPTRDHPEK